MQKRQILMFEKKVFLILKLRPFVIKSKLLYLSFIISRNTLRVEQLCSSGILFFYNCWSYFQNEPKKTMLFNFAIFTMNSSKLISSYINGWTFSLYYRFFNSFLCLMTPVNENCQFFCPTKIIRIFFRKKGVVMYLRLTFFLTNSLY